MLITEACTLTSGVCHDCEFVAEEVQRHGFPELQMPDRIGLCVQRVRRKATREECYAVMVPRVDRVP